MTHHTGPACDVLIVGAGPGGCAAALAVLGSAPHRSVAMVDAANFPRDKTCGDGIAPQVVDRLGKVGVSGLAPNRWRWQGVDMAGLRAAVHRDRGRAGALISAASTVADRNVVWLPLAALLAATRSPRYARAGAAGLAAVGLDAASSHALKLLLRRRRPSRWERLAARDRGSSPSSWSMPSAHTGNAVAFAVAAGANAPALALPLGGFAAVVGLSRLTTARHYPTDVAASLLLGALVGAGAGWAVRRLGKSAARAEAAVTASPGAASARVPGGR